MNVLLVCSAKQMQNIEIRLITKIVGIIVLTPSEQYSSVVLHIAQRQRRNKIPGSESRSSLGLAYVDARFDSRPGRCRVKTLGKFLTPMCNVGVVLYNSLLYRAACCVPRLTQPSTLQCTIIILLHSSICTNSW